MRSILYFIEPRTELNDPLFRYATLRSHILPEIKELKKHNSDLDINVITSKAILEEAIRNQLDLSHAKFISIDDSHYSNLSKSNNEISISLYKNEASENDLKILLDAIKESASEINQPEIIISYESPAEFLKELYPNSVIINSMFGMFSRAPFPAYGILDPFGLYENSFQFKFKDEIKKYTLNEEKKSIIDLLRKKTTKSLAKYHPLKSYLSELDERFDSLVVLACQVDNYFAFNGCSKYENQLQMVEDVLDNSPSGIGVIVTEHSYCRQLNDENVRILQEKYPNFIYFNLAIPTATQFILPYVDGALSVSSSIAYQAALWHLPYYSLGRSQLNIFSENDSFKDFFESVSSKNRVDNDNVLYYLLSHYHVSHKFELFNGKRYFEILNNIYEGIKSNLDGMQIFQNEKSANEIYLEITQGDREWLLKKTISDNSIKPEVDHLRVAMSECNAASFDLFDTLVERDFVEPHELFSFIEPKVRKYLNNKNFQFHYIRRQSEIDLRRDSRGEFEITLDEIYGRFDKYYKLTNQQLVDIKNIEILAEIDLVHPKKSMIREFNFSKLICNSTAIITDIYLKEDTIKKILDKNKITGYDKLLVSAETKTRKHNGSIYPEYLQYLANKNITPQNAIHIGDNKQADGDMAKRHGLRSYTFQKAMDNYRQSKIAQVMQASLRNSGISTSILNGIFANKYNAGHWFKINKDSLFKGQDYNYGYMAVGPLVLGFTQWLHRRAIKLGIKELYFLSRDGWILKQAYDLLYKDSEASPKSKYLYSSRRAAMVASIRTISDIHEVASQNFNARSVSEFLESRFGLELGSIPEEYFQKNGLSIDSIVSPYFEHGKLISLLEDISAIIIENSRIERESYLDYLNSEGFIESSQNNNIAVVDIGYSGSMQYYLKKIIQQDMLHGFYFLTHHHSRDHFNNDHFEGYLANLDDHKISYRHGLNDHVFIFEAALSSPEGSLIKFQGIGEDRKAVYLEAQEEIIRRNALLNAHRGVMDFVNDINSRFSNYKDYLEISPILASNIILNFANNPNPIDAEIFVDHGVENVFGGGSVCLISPLHNHHLDQNGFIKPDIKEGLIKSSKWNKGAVSYYSQYEKSVVSQDKVKSTPLVVSNKTIPAKIVRSAKERKKAKLRRDPYGFFKDSKNPIARNMRVLFKETNLVGRVSSRILKGFIRP